MEQIKRKLKEKVEEATQVLAEKFLVEVKTVSNKILADVLADVEACMTEIEEREKHITEVEAIVEANYALSSSVINLNVGGKRFATSKGTLLLLKGTFFEAMIGSGRWKPDVDGSYFIDRDPKLFGEILRFLRDGAVDLSDYQGKELKAIKKELDFYGIAIPEPAPEPVKQLFGGSTILTEQQKKVLMGWLPLQEHTEARMLFKATADGFGAADFHRLCDNKGPTITVVLSSSGHLFGGYSSGPWLNVGGRYEPYAGSFIFTLTNPHNIPPTKYCLMPGSVQQAVLNNSSILPTFGLGYDICISSSSNTSNHSFTNFPTSYYDTTGRGNSTFTGSYNFTTVEVEVFATT